LTKSDLIDEVVETTGLKKRDVTNVVEAVFGAMAAQLKKHEKVQVVGFGTFEPRRRPARVGRNPRTQEEIRIDASWGLGFRPGKQLKSMITGAAGSPSATKSARGARRSR
jgi:DNA-binding protein HU-beta